MSYSAATKFIFFTGKGGVGKTTMACATAVKMADEGSKVLLICTDPASNLQDVLGTPVTDEVQPHKDLPNLEVMNIIPEKVAEKYKIRVMARLGEDAGPLEKQKLQEELSGACTTEIASFDEFSRYVAGDAENRHYDHIIFDTAPTGHTLRLLELPAAWGNFLEEHPEGASCLRPETGLTESKNMYFKVVDSLKDPELTSLYLVSRTDKASFAEANKTSLELDEIGLKNQVLLINGVYNPVNENDPVAERMKINANEGLNSIPSKLKQLDKYKFPLLPYNVLGLQKLRSVFNKDIQAEIVEESLESAQEINPVELEHLNDLVAGFEQQDHGLIMTMGKGGVGKTIIASAIAIKLAQKGHQVLLTTTDPAAHISFFTDTMGDLPDNLTIERIDPKKETERYVENIIRRKGKGKSPAEIEVMKEDLRSPCTEEVAVFLGFGQALNKAKRQFVVMDTAPTGHTLLLLDTTGTYHNEIMNSTLLNVKNITTPYMELQKPDFAKVLLVTLPELTPIQEAADLQADLERAKITPYAWVVNQSLSELDQLSDPLLEKRAQNELPHIKHVKEDLSNKTVGVPFIADENILAGLIKQ